MKARKILICLIGGLALNANLRADGVVLPGNPYAPVVTRNIFGLNPPTPVDNTAADATPPPKITPNGIMSIFGQLQVLFKVAATAKPGKAAGDDDYILGEGQRQDDIEVIKINEKAGSVTFNNHGTVQELALVSTPASSGTIVSANPVTQTMSGGRRNFRNANNLNPGHATPQNPLADQIPPGLTPEVQTIAIEANRIATQSQVDRGEMPPLPITELTPTPDSPQQ